MEHNEALENGTELDELVRILHIAEANRDTCRALLNALESDVVRLSRVLISATANSKPAESRGISIAARMAQPGRYRAAAEAARR
jgi:hypothetical protein